MATFAEEPDAIFEPCGFAEIFIFAKRLCFMYYSLRFRLVALDSQALVFNFMLLWLVMMSLAQETGFRGNSSFHSWRKKKNPSCSLSKRAKIEGRRWKDVGGKEWPHTPVPVGDGITHGCGHPDVHSSRCADSRQLRADPPVPWNPDLFEVRQLAFKPHCKADSRLSLSCWVFCRRLSGLQIIQAQGLPEGEKGPLVQGNVCNTC